MSADIFVKLIGAVFTIAGIVLTAYLIPWFKQQIGKEKFEKLEALAEYAVRSAEQYFKSGEGEKKKQFVCAYVTDKAQAMGIGLNEQDIDMLIEGAVNFVKNGGG